MRALIFMTVTCLAGYGLVHEARTHPILDPAALLGEPVDPDEGHAIEVRCGDLTGWQRSECESGLLARFDSGKTKPESILRMHCTRVPNVWDTLPAPAPPAVCTRRFGGWLAG